MALFGKKKDAADVGKASAAEKSCCCGAESDCRPQDAGEKELPVKVLGSGCEKCNQLEKATVEALSELGMDTAIEHVKDFTKIAAYGVMSTPALVVDGKVVSSGKVLKKDEVVKLLKKVRG